MRTAVPATRCRRPASGGSGSTLLRAPLRSEPSTSARLAPPIVREVTDRAGAPLDRGVRAAMESRLGASFADVRVHTDARAGASAQAVNAQAYTLGSDIVFGAGQYNPRSMPGRGLIAHELTHVLQQRGRAPDPSGAVLVGDAASPAEREADRYAGTALHGLRPAGPPASTGAVVQRACVGGSWQHEYDGCSLPPWLVDVLGIADKDNPAGGRDTQFALGVPSSAGGRACDRHDECYQTCASSTDAHAACDQRMFADMVATCNASSEAPDVRAACLDWADVYYRGLQLGSGPAWRERQGQVCGCYGPGAPGNPPGRAPGREPATPRREPYPPAGPTPTPTPGAPGPACQHQDGDVVGERIRVEVNRTTFLTSADEARFNAVADALVASGDQVRVHGLASVDGPADFNDRLSCRRAHAGVERLRTRGVTPGQIQAVRKHGEVSGPAADMRAMVLEIVPRRGGRPDRPSGPGRRPGRQPDRPEVPRRDRPEGPGRPEAPRGGRGGRDPGTAPVEPVVPGQVCGPSVTSHAAGVLSKVRSAFAGWTSAQRDAACEGFTSFAHDPVRGGPAYLNAWDVEELFRGTNTWLDRPPFAGVCAVPHPECRDTVEAGGQCFYSGSVNYVVFGVMWRLCRGHFRLTGPVRFSETTMLGLIDLYKGKIPGLRPGSPNWIPSREWARAGYRGWSGGTAPVAGDRTACGPCSISSYTGPAFKFYWYPNGWN